MDIEFYHPKPDMGYNERVYKVALVLQLKNLTKKRVGLIVPPLQVTSFYMEQYSWYKMHI